MLEKLQVHWFRDIFQKKSLCFYFKVVGVDVVGYLLPHHLMPSLLLVQECLPIGLPDQQLGGITWLLLRRNRVKSSSWVLHNSLGTDDDLSRVFGIDQKFIHLIFIVQGIILNEF